MADEEFIVTGYIQKGRHIFSLILAKYRQGTLVYKGHVTSGVTKEVISSLLAGAIPPFHLLPSGNDGAMWGKPNHVCVGGYAQYKTSLASASFQRIPG